MKSTVIATALALSLIVSLFSMAPFQQAQAQDAPEVIERGRAHEIIDNKDGTLTYRAGLPAWTFDNETSQWVPNKLTVINATHARVQSGLISWEIGPYQASVYDANFTEFRATERWLPKISSETIEKFFVSQTVLTNSSGVFVTNTYEATVGSNTITGQIIYAVWDGRPTERIVIIEGLPKPLISNLNIEREWIGLDADVIIADDQSSDSLESGTKTIVQDGSKGRVEFKKGDKLLIAENLASAGDKLDSINYDKSLVKFNYDGWQSTDSKIILKDDTFVSDNPTEDGYISTNSGTGTVCPSSTYSKITGALELFFRAPASGISTFCTRAFIEWEISSIPSGSAILDTVMTVDVDNAAGGRNCEIRPLTNQPSATSTASTLWTDIEDGTAYVSTWTGCATASNNVSVDLGAGADTEVSTRIESDAWFAVGIKLINESRQSGVTHGGYIGSEEFSSSTPKPTLSVTYTPPTVTVPINLVAGDGTQTPFAANFTVSGSGCTGELGHGGSPAAQNYVCSPDSTITITAPSSSTIRGMFSTGASLVQFTSCSSGTCNQQNYTAFIQFAITLTMDGVDSDVNIDVTRTQTGSSGTSAVPGETATVVWGDQASSMAVTNTEVITVNEERFQSYNSTAERTISVTSAQSKTYVYQHEYNMLFRVQEEHLGFIFAPMPTATYTGTITLSNGTQVDLAFDTQITDDHIEPAGGRLWAPNGTTNWDDVIWRGCITNDTGSASITAYGEFDIESNTRHFGYEGERHFRLCADTGTIPADEVDFSFVNGDIEFNAAATGTHDILIEYLPSIYSGVASVTVNGTALPGSQYSISEDFTQSPPVAILTLSDIEFSTNAIYIKFQAASTSGGSGGGGGGGGGTVPPPAGGAALSLLVIVPEFNVQPGGSQTGFIEIKWEGASKIRIDEIKFSRNGEWFTLGEAVPLSAQITAQSPEPLRLVQLTVTLPATVAGNQHFVDLQVAASTPTGSSTTTYNAPVKISVTPTANLGTITLLALVIGGGAGIALAAYSRKK